MNIYKIIKYKIVAVNIWYIAFDQVSWKDVTLQRIVSTLSLAINIFNFLQEKSLLWIG